VCQPLTAAGVSARSGEGLRGYRDAEGSATRRMYPRIVGDRSSGPVGQAAPKAPTPRKSGKGIK